MSQGKGIKCTFASIIGKDFFLDDWLDNIRKIKMPKKEMKLLWVVRDDIDVLSCFRAISKGFKEAELVTSPFKFYDHLTEWASPEGFLKKRWGVAFNMNIVNNHRKGDLFVVEDDIFPPMYAYEKLSTLARFTDVGATTGVAKSFKHKDDVYTAWVFVKKRILSPEVESVIQNKTPDFQFYDYEIKRLPKGDGVEDVHANGTVCTYIKEECIQDYVFVGESNIFTGQDVNLGWHITQRLKRRFLVDWTVDCEHWEVDQQGNIKVR